MKEQLISFDKSMSEMFRQHDYRRMYEFYKDILRPYIESLQPINECYLFQGILNEPHAKCSECGKEEWQHKI